MTKRQLEDQDFVRITDKSLRLLWVIGQSSPIIDVEVRPGEVRRYDVTIQYESGACDHYIADCSSRKGWVVFSRRLGE